MADFNKVGLLVLRNNHILMCRKDHFTSKLILPGGRIEDGETPEECLQREIREELGDAVVLGNVEYLGTYLDKAAFDDPMVHKTVEVKLYKGEICGEPVASSEIVELVWFGPETDPGESTPVFMNRILPDLLRRRILPWSCE